MGIWETNEMELSGFVQQADGRLVIPVPTGTLLFCRLIVGHDDPYPLEHYFTGFEVVEMIPQADGSTLGTGPLSGHLFRPEDELMAELSAKQAMAASQAEMQDQAEQLAIEAQIRVMARMVADELDGRRPRLWERLRRWLRDRCNIG